jgi:hypothetical protein
MMIDGPAASPRSQCLHLPQFARVGQHPAAERLAMNGTNPENLNLDRGGERLSFDD